MLPNPRLLKLIQPHRGLLITPMNVEGLVIGEVDEVRAVEVSSINFNIFCKLYFLMSVLQ